jgi:hypothetical protein
MEAPRDSGLLFVSHTRRMPAHWLRCSMMLRKVAHVRRLKDAASKLETGNFQGVVTQANLEDGSGLDLLQRTSSLGTELVVTDPWADGRRWAEAINLGPTTCSRSHSLKRKCVAGSPMLQQRRRQRPLLIHRAWSEL